MHLADGGSAGHDSHLLYTLSALQLLALCGRLDLADAGVTVPFIAALQQGDGSFAGDRWGEIDTRFTYCALSALALLGRLDAIDVPRAVAFVVSCRNFDGGFGAVPGAESHAGQVFCCVVALAIAGALEHVDEHLLGWWLCERQVDSGGLNGRPEKQSQSRVHAFLQLVYCRDSDASGLPCSLPVALQAMFATLGGSSLR